MSNRKATYAKCPDCGAKMIFYVVHGFICEGCSKVWNVDFVKSLQRP